MTNAQIIGSAMVQAGLDPMETRVDTFAGWSRNNYRIKSGEKAAFKTKIWKPAKKKDDADERMILVNASFFTIDQVVKE